MDQNQNHPPKEIRPPVNLRIKFRSETLHQFIERYAIDVSRGGIFIRTREPLAVGTQLKLDFQYQNGTPLMAGEGTVVWIRELDPNRPTVPPGMGVRFDRLSPESQTVLEQLLQDKAKHDRGGVSPGGTERAGGIAVRRPSSMFAALEPEQVSVMPSSPPSIGEGTTPGSSGAATSPGRPSAAYIPTLSALAAQSQSPVKSATILPPASSAPPATQPRGTSSSMATPAGQPGNVRAPAPAASLPSATAERAPLPASPVRPLSSDTSTDTTVVVRIPSSGATESPTSSAGGPYRPLGTTRNPFSSASVPPAKAPSPEATGASPRLTALSAGAPKAVASRPLPTPAIEASGMMTGPLLTDADLGMQDDDLNNEEPTQIAGRMPSFLISDEDPTSIGPRPGIVPETRFNSAKALEGLHRVASKKDADAGSSRPSDSVLRALGGGREPSLPSVEGRKSGSMAAFAGEASRSRQSLDLAPPLGSGQPGLPADARTLRSTDQQLGTAASSAGLLAGDLAALDPVTSLDGPMGLTGQTALGMGPATPSHAAAGNATARPEPRRPRPIFVGFTVVALGAAAFFVFKYFASQSAQTPDESTPTIAIAPAEPAPTAAAPAPGTTTAASDEAVKPAPSAPPVGSAPAPAGSGSAETASQGAVAAPAKTGTPPPSAALVDELGSAPSAKAAAEAGGAAAAPRKDDMAPATAASKAAASAEMAPAAAAAPRKTVKHKAARAANAHDAEGSAPIVAAASDKAATSDAHKPVALADEPAPPSEAPATTATTAPADDAAPVSGHQIRVTSKPPGADVAIDGKIVGQTPLATSIADVSAPHFLSVFKDGFEPFEQMISSTSAWTKGKVPKGQVAVPTLKINAKLKSTGAGGGDAKPAAGGDAVPAKEAAAPAKAAEERTDRTLAPSTGDERAPVAP